MNSLGLWRCAGRAGQTSLADQMLAAGICLIVLGIGGCTVRQGESPLEWRLLAIQPVNASITNQKLKLVASVRNPGPSERQLAHVIYRVDVAGETFVSGRVQGLRDLQPGQTEELTFRATTNLSGLGQLLVARSSGRSFRFSGYVVRGDVPGRFPFEQVDSVASLDLTRPARLKPLR